MKIPKGIGGRIVYLGGLRLHDFLYFSWWWSKLKKLFAKGRKYRRLFNG